MFHIIIERLLPILFVSESCPIIFTLQFIFPLPFFVLIFVLTIMITSYWWAQIRISITGLNNTAINVVRQIVIPDYFSDINIHVRVKAIRANSNTIVQIDSDDIAMVILNRKGYLLGDVRRCFWFTVETERPRFQDNVIAWFLLY